MVGVASTDARQARRARLGRRPRKPAVAPTRVRTPLGAALPAALWSAVLTLAVVTVLVVLGWALGPHHETSPGVAVATGGQAWLLGQGADLILTSGGMLTVTPLGLLLIPLVVLARSGAWASRAADVRSWPDAARTIGLLTVFYALAGWAVALLAVTPAARPVPVSAVFATGVLAFVGGGWGVLRAAGLWRDVVERAPRSTVPLLRGALGAVAVMVAGGALLVAGALAAHGGQVAELWNALGPDPWGGALLLLVSVALLPNAVLWACAYAMGPGFAVGAGTLVAPTGVSVGAVPALPLLGALPGAGPAPLPSLIGLLLPVVAGVVTGIVVARDRRCAAETAPRAALIASGAGVIAGVAMGLLCSASSGSLLGGRMSDLGPLGLEVALVGALEISVVAAATCWEWRRHALRRTSVDLTETVLDLAQSGAPPAPH